MYISTFAHIEYVKEDYSKKMIEIELTNYRAYKFINIERHSCPLAFYKVTKNYFPILSKLAIMLYCSPATSVPSECMFSTAGLVINHKRNRLKPY
jgi:hypothetical protein